LNILLTNDDGIHALGIRTVQTRLKEAGHNVIVIAPDRERSAASHSLTLKNDIRVRQIADDEYAVSGTPVDCVVIALQEIIKHKIDLVISGTNAGQNMGEDIMYSGTVAAAVEASFFGYRAIAISICSYRDQIYDTAAKWLVTMLEVGVENILNGMAVLNINVPNIPYEEVKGLRLTRVGHRKYYNFIKVIDKFDDGFSYQIGGDLPVWDTSKGTDAEAIAENYISLTPLQFDVTKGDAFPVILEWLESKSLIQLF